MDEITAEYEASALVETPELRVHTRLTLAAKTDLGRVRENNEDKFEFYLPEDPVQLATRGSVFVVCDGMGGHAAGQIASELTAKTFIDVYLNHPSSDASVAMESAVHAANRYVHDVARAVPSRKGMGTTLSALILLQDNAYTVQVGDSRVYRLRDGKLVQLTRDHTWVEEAIRNGFISVAEVEDHPYKHVLTRAVGTEPDVKCEIEVHDLMQGDTFLVCSDGLLNHVEDPQIEQIMNTASVSEAAWKLVGAALQGGGSDNCTVLIVRVDELFGNE
jgi:serine/threonine protein phosphatase PrpC